MRDLPVGTAYAVWVGIGAVLTVVIAMLTGEEPVSAVELLLLAGIIGCVIGLTALHCGSTPPHLGRRAVLQPL